MGGPDVRRCLGRLTVCWGFRAGFAVAVAWYPSVAEPAQESAESFTTATASLQQESVSADDAEEQTEETPTFDVYWDQGLHVRAPHRNFTLRLGGSAQNDSAAFSSTGLETQFGTLENGVQWRRARVFAEGVFARYFDYRLQYDFAQNDPPNLKDAYLGYTALKGARIYIPRNCPTVSNSET